MIGPFLEHLKRLHGSAVLRRREDVLARQVRVLIPDDVASMLDVGCGDGNIAASVAAQRGITVDGVEVLARPKCAVPYQLFDGVTLPYPAESFDVVTLIDVLHHTTDATLLLREASRVSKKYVIIKDHFCHNRLDRVILTVMDWFGNRSHGVDLTYAYLRPREWSKLFQECALSLDQSQDRLGLYPIPFNLLFEDGKHFLYLLSKERALPYAALNTPTSLVMP